MLGSIESSIDKFRGKVVIWQRVDLPIVVNESRLCKFSHVLVNFRKIADCLDHVATAHVPEVTHIGLEGLFQQLK